MGVTSAVEVAPLWSVLLLPPALGALAITAASLDSAFAATAAGRPVTAAELTTPLRETARLLLRQRRVTPARDALLWRAGGAGLLAVAMLAAIVVPLGRHAVSDLAVGVVWFNAMDVLVWAFVWLAGWGANSAYALVGGYRFLAQALAYELPLMFALIAPALAAGSLTVGEVVAAQQGTWFVVWMPVAFAVYLVAVSAFALWGPFAYPAGRDVAGGVAAELSGPDRLLFLAGRYALLATGAAFAVPLFLGGGAGPLLPGWLWSLVKTLAVLVPLVWVRRRLPAVRAERFEELGWLVLLPATLLQVLVVAAVVVVRSTSG